MVIDKRILEMCKTAIRQRLGSLDDLPYELANTVANIFYKSFQLSVRWTDSKIEKPDIDLLPDTGDDFDRHSFLHDSIEETISYYKADHEIINEMTNILRDVDKITKMIHALRKIDRAEKPLAYHGEVNNILDVMKYNIKNAHKMDPIMRAIERNLKRSDIDELPDLYEYI